MALFDFIKKQKKQEKDEAKKSQKLEAPVETHVHDHDEPVADAPQTSFVGDVVMEEFVLETPHVTERARSLSEIGQYTFRVYPNATKNAIKKSVEKLYNVHVTDVRVTKVHEKKRRRGLTEGVKKGYKKAVVALRKGEAIDIF